MNIKALFASTIVLTLAIPVLAQQSIARPTPPTPVSCYFFKGETVEIENTCTYEGSSWAGGGSHTLKWEDGIVTKLDYGLRGRGSKPCSDDKVLVDDDICAARYSRSVKILKRVTDDANIDKIACVQLKDKSICWKP